jgi:predicted phage terminase large subunit-like protein
MRTDTALFACYILFIYFRGQNIARIEREMRSLGHPQFHRRILYPRGPKPGWIAKHNWHAAVDEPKAETRAVASVPPGVSSPCSKRRRSTAQAETRPVGSVSPAAHRPLQQHTANAETNNPQSKIQNPKFTDWLRTVSPNMTWSWRHQQVIIEQLERVTRGECKRLMIFLPPRHGKSELVTVRYTAWRMQRDPAMNVILGSYNQRLADRFSRKIRKTIADAECLSEPALVMAGLPQANAVHSEPQPSPRASTTHSQEGRLAPALTAQRVSSRHGSKGSPNNPSSQPERYCVAPQDPQSAGRAPQCDTRRTTSRGEPACSPFPFVSTKPANSVSEWETTAGGGFRSVGVGSGVTGFGATLIVIDDPIKSRAEAESETYRERVWDWFTDDLYTRLEPDGAIVLIQTRWHEDDLAGRLLREASDQGAEHWDVINLPALSEPPAVAGGLAKPVADDKAPIPQPDAPAPSGRNTTVRECVNRAFYDESTGSPPYEGGDVGRQADGGGSLAGDSGAQSELDNSQKAESLDWRTFPGEPLCPERYNKQALTRIRSRLGEYSFSALYQQRPTPADGGVFKREWFKIANAAPPGLKWKRGYDLAVSTKTTADYTASYRCAFDKEGNLYISGGLRARLEYPDQRRFIIDRIRNEPDTEHGIELALHGQALIQDLRREPGVRGHLLRGIKAESDKLTRALTWAPLAEEGKVFLVRNAMSEPPLVSGGLPKATPCHRTSLSERQSLPSRLQNWIPDFLDEVTAFPNAGHDDQVDAVSVAVQMLKRPGRRAWGF